MVRFNAKHQAVGLLSPVDITENATGSNFVKISNTHWVTFLVFFGTITGDSITLTVESSTGNSTAAGDTAIAARYRLSGAVGSDSWGANTAFSSAGILFSSVAGDGEDSIVMIDVDPDAVQAADADANYLRVLVTPGSSSVTACEVSVIAILEPRYPATAPLSSS